MQIQPNNSALKLQIIPEIMIVGSDEALVLSEHFEIVPVVVVRCNMATAAHCAFCFDVLVSNLDSKSPKAVFPSELKVKEKL